MVHNGQCGISRDGIEIEWGCSIVPAPWLVAIKMHQLTAEVPKQTDICLIQSSRRLESVEFLQGQMTPEQKQVDGRLNSGCEWVMVSALGKQGHYTRTGLRSRPESTTNGTMEVTGDSPERESGKRVWIRGTAPEQVHSYGPVGRKTKGILLLASGSRVIRIKIPQVGDRLY